VYFWKIPDLVAVAVAGQKTRPDQSLKDYFEPSDTIKAQAHEPENTG